MGQKNKCGEKLVNPFDNALKDLNVLRSLQVFDQKNHDIVAISKLAIAATQQDQGGSEISENEESQQILFGTYIIQAQIGCRGLIEEQKKEYRILRRYQ
jgi:hypothetical protein